MRLTGKKIAILLAEGVEDLEFYVPMMRLQEEGAEVLAAGLDMKAVRGKNGLEIKPTTTIADLNPDELYALILPGGWAPDKLRRYPVVIELVQKIHAAGAGRDGLDAGPLRRSPAAVRAVRRRRGGGNRHALAGRTAGQP